MRDADKLWQAGRKTMDDTETKWIFSPEIVKDKTLDEIIHAMNKHKLSQKHSRDAGFWKRISESFSRFYSSDPKNLIEKCGYDAMKLLEKKYEKIEHPRLKYALQMDECLWHLSKYGCRFRKDDFCPKKKECPVGELCIGGHVHVSATGIKVKT